MLRKISNALLITFILSLTVFLLAGCNVIESVLNIGNIPVYKGMSVNYSELVEVKDTNRAQLMSHNISPVDKRDDYHYYAGRGEEIYIYIHIDNPADYEILSFTFNGEKYTSYMFEPGSDMETIIIRYNVGKDEGERSYTIDAIKYVDGSVIKDVIIRGEQTIQIYVSNFSYGNPNNGQDSPGPNGVVCKHEDPSRIIIVYGKEPTCQEDGLTDGRKCTVCNTMVVPRMLIDKLPCIESDWIVDKEATDTETGSEHTECTMCKRVMNEKTTFTFSQGLEYRLLDDGTYEVSNIGTCEDEIVIIPEKYKGITVTSIGNYAFADCRFIKEFVLPNTLTNIGAGAFSGCQSITSLSIPNGPTILNDTFKGCYSLKYISIPASVTVITGHDIFHANNSIERFDVDSENQHYSSIDGHLFNKKGDLLIRYAPAHKNTEFIFDSTITDVSPLAFDGTKYLETVIFTGDMKEVIKYAIDCCPSVKTVIIHEGIEIIQVGALGYCTNLESIYIPKSLNLISLYAFEGTYSIKEIYYGGSEEEWALLEKHGTFELDTANAVVYFNCKAPE